MVPSRGTTVAVLPMDYHPEEALAERQCTLYAGGGPWMAEIHPPSAAHPLSGVGLPQTCPRRTSALPQPGSPHCNPLLAVLVCLEVELSPVWQCCGCCASLCIRVKHFACSMMGCSNLQNPILQAAQERPRQETAGRQEGCQSKVSWSGLVSNEGQSPQEASTPCLAGDCCRCNRVW